MGVAHREPQENDMPWGLIQPHFKAAAQEIAPTTIRQAATLLFLLQPAVAAMETKLYRKITSPIFSQKLYFLLSGEPLPTNIQRRIRTLYV